MPKEPFEIPKYPLPVISAADDAGVSFGGSKDSLSDRTKYWTPGIWQGALLVVSINDQIHTTIITNNDEQNLYFPAFPSNVSISQNNYVIKRLPPSVYRPGIVLTATQQLVQFVYLAQDIAVPSPLNPYIKWLKGPIPKGGTDTGPASATVMTDIGASFTLGALAGMEIFNTKDKSHGTITANTATTVTVAALTQGFTNTWHVGDTYVIGAHLVDLASGASMPYPLPAGFTITILEIRGNFNQYAEGYIFTDTLLFAMFYGAAGGDMVQQASIVEFGTGLIDPQGLYPHTPDLIVVNRGTADMTGGMTVTTLLEAV